MNNTVYDIAIIGGGINGAGIARDAAGRGLSVCLLEKDDLANATSSHSTKLIHGGLRYLEHYEFNLVRKALKERELLWSLAPHIIHPLRLVLPHHQDLRPKWLIRLGLFLYDNIGGRKNLPATKSINLHRNSSGKSLKSSYRHAFEFSDCTVDDARLVILNALSAAEQGATILTHHKCSKLTYENNIWQIHSDNKQTIQAKVVINAAGPWVTDFIKQSDALRSEHNIKLVKGSHIIVPKICDHDKAYFFQHDDQRIAFAIPYHQEFTLIGTTDINYQGDPNEANIEQNESEYLCQLANNYLEKSISTNDIVATFSGVRPLLDDGAGKAQEATRDYLLELCQNNHPPILNIFGGKITTYRKLAEQVLSDIAHFFPEMKGAWTDSVALPGGDFKAEESKTYITELQQLYPFISKKYLSQLFSRYGTLTSKLLTPIQSKTQMGVAFHPNLYQFEVDYLIQHEWAKTAQDILWRRTKMGLFIDNSQPLEDYIRDKIKVEALKNL